MRDDKTLDLSGQPAYEPNMQFPQETTSAPTEQMISKNIESYKTKDIPK